MHTKATEKGIVVDIYRAVKRHGKKPQLSLILRKIIALVHTYTPQAVNKRTKSLFIFFLFYTACR